MSVHSEEAIIKALDDALLGLMHLRPAERRRVLKDRVMYLLEREELIIRVEVV